MIYTFQILPYNVQYHHRSRTFRVYHSYTFLRHKDSAANTVSWFTNLYDSKKFVPRKYRKKCSILLNGISTLM